MINNRTIYVSALFCFLFFFCSCKKAELASVNTATANNTIECPQTLTGKIKTIESSQSGFTTDRFTFVYRNERVDTIKHTALVRGGEDYFIKVFYPAKNVVPSGYHFIKHNGNFNVIGTFLVQSRTIIKKTKIPDFSNPMEESDTAAANDYDYLNNKPIKNKPSFDNAPLYDGLITVDYSFAKNVKQTRLLGGNQETITVNNYDDKTNPLNMQSRLLYFISFRPYQSFKKSEEYLFDFITLAKNNPLKFSFIDNGGIRVTGFKLIYTYNADNLPTKIIVKKADLSNPGSPGPYSEVEKLKITYY